MIYEEPGKIEVGDILSLSQKFLRRGNITPPDEKWEVIACDEESFTIKSRFDEQVCQIKLPAPPPAPAKPK